MFRLSTIPARVSDTRTPGEFDGDHGRPLDRLVAEGSILRVPHMRQSLGYSCAVACVAMLVGARSGTMPSDRVLVKRYGITRKGSSVADIARMVKGELGGGVRSVGRATHQVVASCLGRGHPLLAGVATGGGGHAILVVGHLRLGNGGHRLVVSDPSLSMQLLVQPQTVEAALETSLVIELT